MEEGSTPQSFIQSRTIQLLLVTLAAYAVKSFGLPFMSTELAAALNEVLLVVIPLLIAGAMWFRMKAKAVIDRWW